MKPFKLGKIALSRVVEYEGPTRADFLFPDSAKKYFDENMDWLAPHFFYPEKGLMRMTVQTMILRTPKHTILVDTCVGNHKKRDSPAWNMLDNPWLEDLGKAGVKPEEVDYVMCTHLHVDHVGWNTMLSNGEWVPTFPNARYIFAKKEWEHWAQENEGETRQIMNDSVRPILDAGLAELVEADHSLTDEIWLEPTHGHTPGHVSIRMASEGAKGVITGDMMHHPVQIAVPDLCSSFCVDPAQAVVTRKAFIGRYADTDTRVIGTHFSSPTVGQIITHNGGHRLKVD